MIYTVLRNAFTLFMVNFTGLSRALGALHWTPDGTDSFSNSCQAHAGAFGYGVIAPYRPANLVHGIKTSYQSTTVARAFFPPHRCA